MEIGVLALQGAFAEHLALLGMRGVRRREVRLPEELDGLDGLILPGGESTAIGLLAREFGLAGPLERFGREKAVWGTCAGAILLSRGVAGSRGERLGLLDVTVRRNAFGRQVDSFTTPLVIPALEKLGAGNPAGPLAPREGGTPGGIRPFPGVFIRAPVFEEIDSRGVEGLARLPDGRIVAVRQGRILATSFHPELTGDDRFHRYFLALASR